jgi:hypothetical protein
MVQKIVRVHHVIVLKFYKLKIKHAQHHAIVINMKKKAPISAKIVTLVVLHVILVPLVLRVVLVIF